MPIYKQLNQFYVLPSKDDVKMTYCFDNLPAAKKHEEDIIEVSEYVKELLETILTTNRKEK